jgi:hypothetical protein
MDTYGVNDTYGIEELGATGSALIKAHKRGHVLGDWHPVDNHMRAAGCMFCGRLVWIVRPLGEETWRVGGNAIEADCEREFGNG